MASRSRTAIEDVLKELALFSSLNKRQLRAVADACSQVHYEPGHHLVKELDWGQHMVVIVEGTATVIRGGKAIASVGAGDAIGEMSLIDGEPRSASVIAETDVEGIVIYGTDFRELLATHPAMVTQLLLAQTARLRTLDKQASLHG